MQDLVCGGGAPRCIALHLPAQKVYWTGVGTHTIYRADLDGSNMETVLSERGSPCGLALAAN